MLNTVIVKLHLLGGTRSRFRVENGIFKGFGMRWSGVSGMGGRNMDQLVGSWWRSCWTPSLELD